MKKKKKAPVRRRSKVSVFKPVTAADVTDEKLVAGQLRALQVEVKTGFDIVGTQLKVLTEQLGRRVDDHEHRITNLERVHVDHGQRIDDHDRRLTEIEHVLVAVVK